MPNNSIRRPNLCTPSHDTAKPVLKIDITRAIAFPCHHNQRYSAMLYYQVLLREEKTDSKNRDNTTQGQPTQPWRKGGTSSHADW